MNIICPTCAQDGVKRSMHPIPGQTATDKDGHAAYEALCSAGHRQWFKRIVRRGPCPNCKHAWVEPIPGGGDLPKAAPTNVRVYNNGSSSFGQQSIIY